MDTILLLLSFFVVVKSLFMTSLLPNRWYRAVFSLMLGLFVIAAHPYALEMNKLRLQQVLSEQNALMNISLVVMADTLLTCYFCAARLHNRYEEGKKLPWHTVLWRHTPSLLVFPVLYYIHITLFFSFPGTGFALLTGLLAGTVTASFVAASFSMRRWIHEKEGLLETVILLTFFICILVISCTVFHPSATIYHRGAPTDWKGCLYTLGLLLLLAAAGAALSRLKKRIIRFFKHT